MASDDWVTRVVRGRQELSREQDVTSMRVQLLGGLARAMAEKGYAATTVEDVVSEAELTSADFFEQYADIESCFLAAYDLGIEVLLTTVQDSLGPASRPPLERFDALLASYLGLLSSEPPFARTFLIEVYAAGPRSLRRRADVLDRFAVMFAEILAPATAPGASIDPFVWQAMVGAVESCVTSRVAAGEFDRLPELREPLTEFVTRLVESIGPEPEAAGDAVI